MQCSIYAVRLPFFFSYINQAPALTHLPDDVFVGVPDTFRSLYAYHPQVKYLAYFHSHHKICFVLSRRIINSGLIHVPVLYPLSPNMILHMVYGENLPKSSYLIENICVFVYTILNNVSRTKSPAGFAHLLSVHIMQNIAQGLGRQSNHTHQ